VGRLCASYGSHQFYCKIRKKIQMNLNEQLRQAYEEGRRQGLNEQPFPGDSIYPYPFVGPMFPNFVGPIDPSRGIYGDDSYEPVKPEYEPGPPRKPGSPGPGDIIGYDEYGRPVYYGDPPGIPLYDENGNPIGRSGLNEQIRGPGDGSSPTAPEIDQHFPGGSRRLDPTVWGGPEVKPPFSITPEPEVYEPHEFDDNGRPIFSEDEGRDIGLGYTLFPDGSIRNPDGSITYPDGTIVLPDGTIVLFDGTVQFPDGTIVYPDGVIMLPDGTIIYPEQEMDFPILA